MSTTEKEDAKLDLMFKMKFKEALSYINKGLGIDQGNEYIPESIEELNLYEAAGGFKLAKETEIEQGLDYTFYISEWKETKKKLIRDACVINCLGTKDFTDPYTKKVKTRYVDPEYYIGQYSKHWDHNNMSYGGEIIQVPIGDIRKMNIPGVEENSLIELARQWSGVGGNISVTNCQYYEDSNTGNYDSMLVDVLDAEWKSVNSEYKTTRKNQFGTENMYDEKWGKVYDSDTRKTSKYDIQVVYKCKWILGTDHVYDFGLQYDIPRPGKKEVELSYHLYKLPYRSLVSLAESHLHQIALTFFKLQNAIAMASPPGIAIEFTAIQNMTLGGNKLKPLELLKIKRQTGDLIYKATTHAGHPNTPGAYRPIQELQGGIGSQLQEFITIFDFNMNAIREITGINQIADASNPNPEMSVGGSEIAMAATNNALRPIYSAYIHIKEQTAKNISLRLQLLIKHDKEAYTGYIPVIGSTGVQVISVGADTVDANYYIKYEAKPTEKRKEIIRQAAIAAMSPDRDGVKGIELPDYLMIERQLENGSLKFAEVYLNYRSEKNKERQLKLQRDNMSLDKQRELEAVQLKSQLSLQELKQKTDEDIRLYEAKKILDEKYAVPQHAREMQKIGAQASMGIVQDAAKQEVATAVTAPTA
jgi:hypothetical protein